MKLSNRDLENLDMALLVAIEMKKSDVSEIELKELQVRIQEEKDCDN
jgi:hypothetical protein